MLTNRFRAENYSHVAIVWVIDTRWLGAKANTWGSAERVGILHTHTQTHIHTMTKGIRNRSLVAWKVWQKLQEAAREERSKSFGVRQTLMIVRWRIKCKPKYNTEKGKVGGAGGVEHCRALRQIQKPSSKVCSLRDLCTLWFIAKGRWERDRQSEEMEERGREREIANGNDGRKSFGRLL